MRFFIKKRRQTPTIIVVALIDVLIVLLIFLMVTTTFRQQAALKLALPESTQALKSGANEAAPLLVSVDAKGMLRLGPEAIAITPDEFKQRLVDQAGRNPDLKLAISADKEAPVGQLVKVWDAAKEAHVKAVSMFVKEVPKQ